MSTSQAEALDEPLDRRAGDAHSDRNRRAQPRSTYDCVQLIALYDGETLPSQADFQHVVCRDLSTNGISFLLPHRITTDRIIVALGPIPFSFLVAEIVRSELTDDGDVLVGCRFVERLKL